MHRIPSAPQSRWLSATEVPRRMDAMADDVTWQCVESICAAELECSHVRAKNQVRASLCANTALALMHILHIAAAAGRSWREAQCRGARQMSGFLEGLVGGVKARSGLGVRRARRRLPSVAVTWCAPPHFGDPDDRPQKRGRAGERHRECGRIGRSPLQSRRRACRPKLQVRAALACVRGRLPTPNRIRAMRSCSSGTGARSGWSSTAPRSPRMIGHRGNR